MELISRRRCRLVVFIKFQNNRDIAWRAITKFVGQLGRYEPSSANFCQQSLLDYVALLARKSNGHFFPESPLWCFPIFCPTEWLVPTTFANNFSTMINNCFYSNNDSSVTRWLDYFSIFGLLQQWKFAQNVTKSQKYDQHFSKKEKNH